MKGERTEKIIKWFKQEEKKKKKMRKGKDMKQVEV